LPCSSRGSSSAGTTYVILGTFQLDPNNSVIKCTL
jgi:hypothetical protein